MINLKSKQGKARVKRANNERWYICVECDDFKFAIYNQVGKGNSPHCPKCGDSIATLKIKPPVLSARENYKPWKDEELVYIHQVLNKEIMPYQCAIKLDRSLASIESKCRRVKRDANN
jgi:hypothetical protein